MFRTLLTSTALAALLTAGAIAQDTKTPADTTTMDPAKPAEGTTIDPAKPAETTAVEATPGMGMTPMTMADGYMQVDGDYWKDITEASFTVRPAALRVVA